MKTIMSEKDHKVLFPEKSVQSFRLLPSGKYK